MKKLLIPIFLVVFIIGSLLAGCGNSGQQATTPGQTKTTATTPKTTSPVYGGTLRIGDHRETTWLGFPQKMTGGYVKRQAGAAIENLLRLDEQGKEIPWLASAYTVDPTAKTITLTLANGVKFHDGTDFNAEAVKWNLDLAIKNKQFGSVLMTSVVAVDPSTVRITLSQWDNTVISMLASQYIGMMISPTAYKANTEEWVVAHPVGTGPFKFVTWEKDVRISYVKNTNYWKTGMPYLDGIENIRIADKVVGGLAFRRSETDMHIEPLYEEIAGYAKDGYNVSRLAGGFASAVPGIIFDSADSNSPFYNLKVRQAVAHVVDTKAMVNAVLHGEGAACTQWMYEGHWAYDPTIVGYPLNVDKAKQLMAEAGYASGFKTKYTFGAGNVEYDQCGQALAGFLTKIGITLELNPLPQAQVTPIWRQGGTWDGLINLYPPPYPDVAAGIRDRFAGDGQNYKEMLAPDDYKQAIQNAVTAADFANKQKYTREALKLLTDKYCLAVPFYHPNRVIIEAKYVHDTGLFSVATDSQWTPERGWMEKH